VWFAALALVASASLLNMAIAAIPRMLSGMAQSGQAFPLFGYIHPRLGTPVYAIVFVGALPLIGLIWSGADTKNFLPLTITASVSWLLAYIVAQVSLLVLRRRYPNAVRPFKVPAHPWIPLLAIAGMVYVVMHSSPDPAMTPRILQYMGIVLGLFALVGGLWVKFVMKKGLFEPVTPASLGGTR
jgi:amino acid transporter